MPLQPPLNEYDVGEPITLSCLFLSGQTVGRMERGQSTVFVRDPSGLDLTVGAEIVIVGAGYTGGDLRTTVVSDDNVGAVVVADACRSTVSEAIVGSPADPNPVVLHRRPARHADAGGDGQRRPDRGRLLGGRVHTDRRRRPLLRVQRQVAQVPCPAATRAVSAYSLFGSSADIAESAVCVVVSRARQRVEADRRG